MLVRISNSIRTPPPTHYFQVGSIPRLRMQVNSDNQVPHEMPMSVMSIKQVANDASFHCSERRPRTAARVVVSIGRWSQSASVIADSFIGHGSKATSKTPTAVSARPEAQETS